jgi:hypothetical protein
MARSPIFKVYSAEGEYLASAKYAEDAAAVVGLRGEGATIRRGHTTGNTVWTEGVDGLASESFDACAELVYNRIDGGINKGGN